MEKIRVVVYGVGPIGIKMIQYLSERDCFEIAGAIDIDPDKAGKSISEIAELNKDYGMRIESSAKKVLRETRPDAVVLTTTSVLSKIQPQITEILEEGIDIVSTCEELAYPWEINAEIAREIDSLAKEKNVSVLATGVNPGFLMDFLPVAVTGVCKQVEEITVERVQDASRRRLPFQAKVGVGISVDEFTGRVQKGILRHVGLTESIQMIASRMGWPLDKTEDIIEPVIAKEKIALQDREIEKGLALGVKQTGCGYMNGKPVITLHFIAAAGIGTQYDRILVKGVPPIDMTIKDGVNGDIATCSMVMNAIPVVLKARPGLRTMADIEPVSCFT